MTTDVNVLRAYPRQSTRPTYRCQSRFFSIRDKTSASATLRYMSLVIDQSAFPNFEGFISVILQSKSFLMRPEIIRRPENRHSAKALISFAGHFVSVHSREMFRLVQIACSDVDQSLLQPIIAKFLQPWKFFCRV